MLLCIVGHRSEVLNFLAKKKKKKGRKEGRKEREGRKKKVTYQIPCVHKIKKEKHQMK